MELRDYLSILWRRKWLVLFTVAMAVGIAGMVSWFSKPQYVATATIRISTARSGAAGYTTYNLDYSDRLMNTYANIITSRPLVTDLKRVLHLSSAPPVGVTILANTELMEVSVTGSEPEVAAKAANALGVLLINVFEQDQHSGIVAGGGTDTISIVDPAVAPHTPVTPRKTFILSLSFVLGLVAGVVLAVLFEKLQINAALVLLLLGVARHNATPRVGKR